MEIMGGIQSLSSQDGYGMHNIYEHWMDFTLN
jgi:hypothetical protein